MMRRPLATGAAVAVLAASLVACGGDAAGRSTLRVYAAASLATTFEALAEEFEEAHPGVEVELNVAGSSDLVAQIQQGAPADVFASADLANMEKLGADAVGVRTFATNTLAIAVPAGNPARVEGLADLAGGAVQLVVCAPEVPCGAAAATVEARAGLDWRPVSEEQNVGDVLGKVRSGEADAGLVYVTDIAAAGDAVAGIAIPAAANAVTTYPIATVDGAAQVDLAHAWIDLVTGPTGQRVLSDAGFGKA